MAGDTGDGTNPAQPDVPYDEVSTLAWANQVRETFDYRAGMGVWILFGTCPRCAHPTSQAIAPEIFITKVMKPHDDRPEPVRLPKITVRCACDEIHAAGKTGCGAFGELYDVRFE